MLRVIIDRPVPAPSAAAATHEDSVGIEECQRVSQDLSAMLDVEETPGEPRSASLHPRSVVAGARSAAAARGRLPAVRGAAGEGRDARAGRRPDGFAGRLRASTDGVVVLEEGRKAHRLPLAQISARAAGSGILERLTAKPDATQT